MIKLSDRLSRIARMVDRGERLADIGTDHGYIPIYLAQRHISPYIIMSDISRSSLDKALNNCKKYDLQPIELAGDRKHICQDEAKSEFNSISQVILDARVGDGLDVLDYGEVDVVVLAGMGGKLIAEILDWNTKKTFSFKKLIIQARNNFGYAVKWLKLNGYSIDYIDIAKEGDRFPEIVMALAPPEGTGTVGSVYNLDEKESYPDPHMIKYEYPDELLDSKSDYLEDYLKSKLMSENRIKEKILTSTNYDPGSSAKKALNYRRMAVERIGDLIEKLERGTSYEDR